MGRPTIAEQIARAATEGNLEKVKELSAKLIPVKKKTIVKSKTKSKKKPTQPIEVYEDEVEEIEEEQSTIISNTNPKLKKGKDKGLDFITSARNPDKKIQEKYVDEDGRERTRAKVVPFKIIKNRKNTWKDNLTVDKKDIDTYKKVKKKGYKPVERNREPTNKIKMKCFRCKETKIVWPGEVTHPRWSCDECLMSGGRGRN